MSSAAIRQVIDHTTEAESKAQLQVVARGPQPQAEQGLGLSDAVRKATDDQPLLMIVAAGAIAAVAALTLIGSVVVWLALRQYGVLVF
jgi:hypothetical protein